MASVDRGQGPADVLNWSGTDVIAKPDRIVQPRTLAELRRAVANRPGPVQPLGARFSLPPLLDARPAMAVDLRHLRGVVDVTATSVTAWAGTTLAELHQSLASRGLRIDASPPVIATQTLGGAIATGTHGQGLHQSTIGDAVLAFAVMNARGDIEEIAGNHPDVDAFRMNLGALGIVVQVQLRTVPNQLYVCERSVVPGPATMTHYSGLAEQSEFCKAWWFPEDDVTHVWMLRPATRSEARQHFGPVGTATPIGPVNGSMNDTIEDLATKLAADTRTNERTRSQFRTIERFKNFRNVVGDVYSILCKGIPVAQMNCEIGIPLDRAEQAHGDLYRWCKTTGPSLHYPLILRAVGPSRAWLSPAYDTPTLHVGMLAYRPEVGPYPPLVMRAITEMQWILAGHGGLPHLGKHFDSHIFRWTAHAPARRFMEVVERRRSRDWLHTSYLDSVMAHAVCYP